jgi:hypothetical protein
MFESGTGTGTVGESTARVLLIRKIASMPLGVLQSAAARVVGSAAAQRLTHGQATQIIGLRAALMLASTSQDMGCMQCGGRCAMACSSSAPMMGRVYRSRDFLGAPGDSSMVLDPNLLGPLDGPQTLPLPLPPASAPGPAPSLPPDGFPAAPPFRPGNWDGNGTKLESPYHIAQGDTLSGLARLYLGGPQRWQELWTPNKFTFASPDKIPVGGKLIMPQEAIDAANFLLRSKSVPATPASPGAPGSVPGAIDPGNPSKPAAPPGGIPVWGWVAGGVAGVAVIGGVIYAVVK